MKPGKLQRDFPIVSVLMLKRTVSRDPDVAQLISIQDGLKCLFLK